jgi:hypothetical protein
LNIAAELPGVKIFDGESEMSIADEEKLLSGNFVTERRVLQFDLDRIDRDPEDVSVKDDPESPPSS